MTPSFSAVGYVDTFPSVHPVAPLQLLPAPSDDIAVESHADQDNEDTVKVVVRVRPPLDRELRAFQPYSLAAAVDSSGRLITLSENLRAAQASNGVEDGVVYNTYRFAFDSVYGPETPQNVVYEQSARGAVNSVLAGYNASIIAFGQTGAGKTHTMTGALVGDERGIIPRAVDDVFSYIQRDTGGERCKFLVRASYLQIYNEVISDLLKPDATNLSIREDRRRGVHVEGLSEWIVRTPADVYALMERGAALRATGATKLNELSSRSHAIFILIVEKSSLLDSETKADPVARVAAQLGEGRTGMRSAPSSARQTVRVGKLNLVDLAGSERVHLTGAVGKRLEESKKINQSLSALGNVIAALTDPKGKANRPHVPYRDSKLTRILEDSLGGNCKTTFMAMISPAVEAFAESLSTLKFAHRAKRVRNAPKINEDLDHVTLLRKYERELRKLRAELQQRSRDLVDRRLVLQIEEARRREQADKIAAITALERQSAEIARQKEAMATLQNRIASMQSQLLIGGHKLEDTPEFRTLLAAEQARIRQQYESRLAELEAEAQAVAADRAAAERLKALLLKQRDVMVALTERLSERDREVLALQTALEAAEARAKESEDRLDTKTAELIAVRKSVVVPSGNDPRASDIDGPWTIPASPPSFVHDGSPSSTSAGPQEVVALVDTSSGSEHDDVSSPRVGLGEDERRKEKIVTSSPLRGTGAPASLSLHGLSSRKVVPFPTAVDLKVEDTARKIAVEGDAERDALRCILRDKVAWLVEEMGRSVTELGPSATEHPTLTRQLKALRTLVARTVEALE